MKDSTRVGSSERLEIPGFTLYGEASIWITSERWREGPLPKNVDFHTSAAGSCVKQDGEAIVTSGWSERRPENRGSSLTHAPKISSFFYTFREIKFYLILDVSVRVLDTCMECFNFSKVMKLKQEFPAFSPTSKLQKVSLHYYT